MGRQDPSSARPSWAKIRHMRPSTWLLLIVQAALVFLVMLAVGARMMPLGVPGEWEWLRAKGWPSLDGMCLAMLGVGGYSSFAAIGMRKLGGKRHRAAEAGWLAALLVAAIATQVIVPMAAAPGYDLSKWAAVNYLPGSAGYFKVARQQAAGDPWKFLADYPQWIRGQDSLHIGTHPPGLIAVQCLFMGVMDRSPALTGFLLDHMPASVEEGFKAFTEHDPRPLSRADRATLYATALLTLIACAGTVVPLYLLARAALPAPAAWAAAALWPLAPAVNLFQPVADTAYPLLSTSALALAAWAVRLRERPGRVAFAALLLAIAAGFVMAAGMYFTLAFLPVGLIVALVVGFHTSLSWRSRALLILAIGLGFITTVLGGWAVTRANPLVIGWWNLHHHARFYDEYPRTYLLWLLVNPLELAIAVGLPSVVLCVAGLFAPRGMPLSVWSTLAVLALADLIGRNMGEVARLWILYMPPLLVGAAYGCSRSGSGPAVLAGSTVLLGVQTLALQSMIQVVYPV
jgi:methylthioxylose transferase